MRKIILIILLAVLATAGITPGEAAQWSLKQHPADRASEQALHAWVEANRHDFCHGFDDEEAALLKRLVSGVLIWAETNGNRFDAGEFLNLFSDRGKGLNWCVFPSGGMIFVLHSSYLRIALDEQIPGDLPAYLRDSFPEEGRWFLAYGSGNRTSLVYFQHLKSSGEGLF